MSHFFSSLARRAFLTVAALALSIFTLASPHAVRADDDVRLHIGAGPGGMRLNIGGNGHGEGERGRRNHPGSYRDAVVVDRADLLTTLGNLTEELARLQGVTGGGDPMACRRAAQDLKALRRSIKRLQDDLRMAPGIDLDAPVAAPPPPQPAVVEVIPAPPPQPAGPFAMDNGRFSEIVSAIQSESFANGKLAVLRDATDYAWYSSAQVVRIIGLFDFGPGKLKALQIVAPQIVDPDQSFKIYSAFDFDSNKKKAREILRASRR